MPAGRVLWARFGGSDWAFCITTIRFARRWESYVLNRVNKALLRSPVCDYHLARNSISVPCGPEAATRPRIPEK